MGVSNLWQLLEPARTPLHDSGTGLSLAGPAGSAAATADKVLAVDVSIWLQQLVKGAERSSGHRSLLAGQRPPRRRRPLTVAGVMPSWVGWVSALRPTWGADTAERPGQTKNADDPRLPAWLLLSSRG